MWSFIRARWEKIQGALLPLITAGLIGLGVLFGVKLMKDDAIDSDRLIRFASVALVILAGLSAAAYVLHRWVFSTGSIEIRG